MKLGALDISTVKLGANQVQAVYQGGNLVWQNAPVATAATGVGQTSFTANWNAYTGAVVYLLDVSESSDFSTFVYEDQQVNAPTTSYVVIGLNPNTTYYYRVRASTEALFDPDAQAFFDRVTTASGSLSTTEQDAVNTLVVQMKADGIWTKMKAVYPMVGASAAACAQNLKSASFTGTFTSGWDFSSTGVTPNGSSAYFNTNLVPNTNLTFNSASFGVYSRSNFTPTANQSYGVTSSNTYLPLIGSTFFPDKHLTGLVYNFNTPDILESSTGQDFSGFFQITRTSSTNAKLFRNNSQLAAVTTNSQTIQPSTSFLFGALRASFVPFQDYCDFEHAFAFIGDGLTDDEASDFYTAVQFFQETLNRNVGPQVVSDADAQAYINRVYNAGGTLTDTEANAVNQLTIDMKADGIWTKMKAVYPMVGASASACAQNLKSSSFTGTFTSGFTFASTGVTGNGTSAYMDAGFLPSTQMTNNDTHISYYSRTNTSINDACCIGTSKNPSALPLLSIYTRNAASRHIVDAYSYVDNRIEVTNSVTSQCFYLNTRTSSTSLKFFRNGVQLGTTDTTTSSQNITTCDKSVFLNAMNLNGVAGQFAPNECAFASIGDGLTDTEASDFYTAVQAFNTTLSRQV